MQAISLDTSDQQLITAWLAYHRLLESSGDLTGRTNIADACLWAIEQLDNLCKDEPEHCWLLIQQIFILTESDYQRAALAAGLLEDLLNLHGSAFIDRIEKAAKEDEKFRELLTGVWQNTISNEVWNRIQSLRAGSN